MFSHDKAIEKSKDDILNRKDFAEKLAETISKYDGKESLVMALNGDWGSGKSSVINMVNEECEQKYSTRIKVIKFNPWFYTDKHNLILKFFGILLNELNIQDKLIKNKKIFDNLNKYADNFASELASIVPGAGIFIKGISIYSKSKSKKLEGQINNAEYQRTQVREAFAELDFKFLIVIDDIDRLSGSEIRDIFQLVKLVGDIPNIVYLLSFDKGVVCKALEQFQEGKGHDYLEKIVQVPFELPHFTKIELEKYLISKINNVIENTKDGEIETGRWSELNNEGLKFVFKTLRDVNRFINSLQFDYTLLKGEVNIVDLIGITAIKVFNSKLYNLIRNNKSIFLKVVEGDRYSSLRQMGEINYKEELESIAVNTGMDNAIKKIVLVLFPLTSTAYGDKFYSSSAEDEKEIRIKQRISSEECFDIYFKLGVPMDYFSNNQMEIILNLKDEDSFKKKLFEFKKTGKLVKFLLRLDDYTDIINVGDVLKIVNTLFDLGDDIYTNEYAYGYRVDVLLFNVNEKLLSKLESKKDRYLILKYAIKNSTNSLYQCIFEITQHDISYGRYGDSRETNKAFLIDEDDLIDIEQTGRRKIEEWYKLNKLIGAHRLAYVLARWKEWGGEIELKEFIEKCYESIEDILKLILSEMKRVSNQSFKGYEQSSYYELYYNEIRKKYDIGKIYNLLNKVSKEQIENFTIEEKEALKLFLDHYEGKIQTRY